LESINERFALINDSSLHSHCFITKASTFNWLFVILLCRRAGKPKRVVARRAIKECYNYELDTPSSKTERWAEAKGVQVREQQKASKQARKASKQLTEGGN